MLHHSINTSMILAITTLTDLLAINHISWEDAPAHFDMLLKRYPTQKKLLLFAFQAIVLMDSMPGGFLLYKDNPDQTILFANKTLIKLFQYETFDEFKKHTKNSFLHFMIPEDQESVLHAIQAQLSLHPDHLDHVQYRIETKNKTKIWVKNKGKVDFIMKFYLYFYSRYFFLLDKKRSRPITAAAPAVSPIQRPAWVDADVCALEVVLLLF